MARGKNQKDAEETAEILDFVEDDPIDFWEKKQRELVTSVVDYNLGTLADLVTEGTINLDPKYQRRFRWDDIKKSKLIESFLMNVPVPPIFLNEDAYGQYSVIDGKQRLMAVKEFLRGRLKLKGLKVFSDINDHTYDELPTKLKTVIKTRPILRSIIILRQSDEDVKFEVFQRINTGGVNLNAQEIRNSTYPGAFNDLILELSENKLFHKLLGVKKKQSAIYQEMRDAELVLRFLTFRNNWQTFRGGMKRHMDQFMANNQYTDPTGISTSRDDFLRTVDVVAAGFGENAFRRWLPDRNAWRNQALAALFDAQMFSCRGRDAATMFQHQRAIVEEYKELFSNAEFRKAIDSATNAPTSFRTRINMLSSLLDTIVRG